jgi:hypothetical protein
MQHIPPIHSQAFSIPRRAFALLAGVIAACALSSCAFLQPPADPTRFYVLTLPSASSPSAADGEFARWKIGLRSVELPAYLQTKLMVVRTGTNEIHFAEFDRWAEPLDAGIGRVIKEKLISADNVKVVALNSHGEDTLDYEVMIRVLACEGVRGESGTGSIRLSMSWEIQSVGTNATAIKRGGFTAAPAAWDGKDYGQLALQLSKAIADAGKALAVDLPMKVTTSDKSNTLPGPVARARQKLRIRQWSLDPPFSFLRTPRDMSRQSDLLAARATSNSEPIC